jgi:hypothetical protein
MLVDPPRGLEALVSHSVSTSNQSSHEISHPNPQDASDCPILVDPPRDLEAPEPLSVSTPASTQVAGSSYDLSHPNSDPSDCPPIPVDSPHDLEAYASTPAHIPGLSRDLPPPNSQSEGNFVGADEDDEDDSLYDASRQDVLNAYSFVALKLEEMPIITLDDLLYYRYEFSLNEVPYTGIPATIAAGIRPFRSWTEVCRAVGGQQLESSTVDRAAIQDFLSILAGCADSFNT